MIIYPNYERRSCSFLGYILIAFLYITLITKTIEFELRGVIFSIASQH